jgi:hypothetical protein
MRDDVFVEQRALEIEKKDTAWAQARGFNLVGIGYGMKRGSKL